MARPDLVQQIEALANELREIQEMLDMQARLAEATGDSERRVQVLGIQARLQSAQRRLGAFWEALGAEHKREA
jgi:hypothetical protein